MKSKHILVKRLAGVFLVVVIAAAGDRIAAGLLKMLVSRSNQRFSLVYNGAVREGVLVLGSSRGVNAVYVPEAEEQLRTPVMNLSFNGMSTEIAEAVLRDYLDRHERPRMVILEVTNVNLGNGLINDLKLFAGESDRLRAILRRENPNVYWGSRIVHLYRYNSELFLRALYYLRANDQQWANERTITPAFVRRYSVPPQRRDMAGRLRAGNLDALGRIVDLCSGRGIPLHLVIAPYLPEHRRALVDFHEWKAQVTDAAGGMPVHDYSGAIEDPSCFADPVHLNREGAVMLLRQMVEDEMFVRLSAPGGADSGKGRSD